MGAYEANYVEGESAPFIRLCFTGELQGVSPLAETRGNGFGVTRDKSPFATTRRRGVENGSRADSRSRADPDPDPFWFASRGFGLRDRFASSPMMSPRYVR